MLHRNSLLAIELNAHGVDRGQDSVVVVKQRRGSELPERARNTTPARLDVPVMRERD